MDFFQISLSMYGKINMDVMGNSNYKENKYILGTVVATLASERYYVCIEKPIFITSLLVLNSIMSI